MKSSWNYLKPAENKKKRCIDDLPALNAAAVEKRKHNSD